MRELLYRILVPAIRWFNRGVRAVSAATHLVQYKVEGALRPSAEWFDHQLDAQYQWPRLGRSGFVERGVLSALALRPGGSVLELCCGDGFSTAHFYAPKAGRVIAVDANEEALAHARTFNAADNVRYERCDITRSLPPGPFDNVVWDTAIHHFTRETATAILRSDRVRADARRNALRSHRDRARSRTTSTSCSRSAMRRISRPCSPQCSLTCVSARPTDPLRTDLFFFAGLHAAGAAVRSCP